MNLLQKVVIVKAEPVLGVLLKYNVFERYVKHWLVSGYSWDGDCMCTAVMFKEIEVNIHSLRVTKNEIVNKLKEVK